MKRLLLILFTFSCLNIFAQTQDTLKSTFSTFEQTTAYYDRLNSMIVVNSIPENTKYSIELYDITGLSIVKSDLFAINRKLEIPLPLKQGIYILIIGTKNFSITRKFRVN
ncbi:MAG: T9SS type A sorting domain-containing protein [Bacteroidales bacterium]|nr:T9SS type A sorting domain-containing protein [Bacteroidales bacterium]